MKFVLFASDKGDLPAILALHNNQSATTDPGVTDDAASGYEAGSVWINRSANRGYLCTDPTAGAAVWALQGESGISPTELALLDGAVAGTIVAGKAVAVDSNKDAADFRNLSGTNLKAGKSGAAGSIDIFPTTTSKGKTEITSSDNSTDTVTAIVVAAQAGARTLTVPDGGQATASFVLTEGAQTLNGVKSFGSPPVMSGASIGAATIPNTALAANGGLAALIGAGLGASHSYLKTQSGAATLLASVAGDRSVLIVVVVDTVFANGDGAQPTFQIGQTGTAAKFADTSAFTNKAAGSVLTFAGTLTGTDNLIVTGVAGTGTTETGGLTVTVLALPV